MDKELETVEQQPIDAVEQTVEETVEETAIETPSEIEVETPTQKTEDVVVDGDLTFDDILSVKEYQQEFDRRLGKSLKTQELKHNKMVQQLQSENKALKEQVEVFNQNSLMNDKKVASKYHEFVRFEARKRLSEGKTFEEALNEYLLDNPHFAEDTSNPTRPMASSPSLDGQVAKPVVLPTIREL